MYSVFELFRIGLGPSSSHTVGPMLAANAFTQTLNLDQVDRFKVDLYGSLALTGKGHGTDKAVMLGLAGLAPDTVDPDEAEQKFLRFGQAQCLDMSNQKSAQFTIEFHPDTFLAAHPNGVTFTAFAEDDSVIAEQTWFSIGGGAVVQMDKNCQEILLDEGSQSAPLPYPFTSGDDILKLCNAHELTICSLAMANEQAMTGQSQQEIEAHLDQIWDTMNLCIERGCKTEGELPGGLDIQRRAPRLKRELEAKALSTDPLAALDWVSLFALAVNEENAAGGRVVTAPTNGAAGVIPAVLAYLVRFEGVGSERIRQFLLTAAAIGMLYKQNASISAAEVGCQGEIGVASSMAAAGFAAVMGGTVDQIENAAEIAMEHHLGMTCDPIGGLVQVPCIERNTMGAIKAINAARLSLRGDGKHRVSLDSVIDTMMQTGKDMQSKYKETAQGGLAVNVVVC